MRLSSMSSNAREVFFGRPPGIGLLMMWITCALIDGLPKRRRRMLYLVLNQAERFRRAVREALRAEAPLDHDLARHLDGVRIGRVQEQHRRGRARIEFLLALPAQEIAHRDRHIAEVDVHRTGIQAFVADRAVVGHVGKFVEVLERHAAAGLLFVEERFDQQRRGQDLVARRVQQVWRAARGSRTPACTCRNAGSP